MTLYTEIYFVIFDHFNSHAHVERDEGVFFHCEMLENFNSHAHVERDRNRKRSGTHKHISTHTLTWSVTVNTFRYGNFISDFNSHAHVERDEALEVWDDENEISTHTLTWSVT